MAARRLTVGLVLMLVASLATSAWASCMADSAMTPKAQMACCKGGQDKCPMADVTENCCKTDAQRHPEASIATYELLGQFTLNAPALVGVVSHTGTAMIVVQTPVFASTRDVLKRPAAPPYLLASALLI